MSLFDTHVLRVPMEHVNPCVPTASAIDQIVKRLLRALAEYLHTPPQAPGGGQGRSRTSASAWGRCSSTPPTSRDCAQRGIAVQLLKAA